MADLPVKRVRADLVLKQRVDEAGDETYVVKDRVSNRYWLVGPLQFEIARIYAQPDKDSAALKAELQDCFEDPIEDADVASVLQDFAQLGLLQMELRDVVAKAIPPEHYAGALSRFGLTEKRARKAGNAALADYLAQAHGKKTAVDALFASYLRLYRKSPNDPLIQRAGEAFYAADAAFAKARAMVGQPLFVRWLRLQKSLVDPTEAFDRWLPRLRFVFTRWFFVLTLLVSAWGFIVYFANLTHLQEMMSIVSSNALLLLVCSVIMLFIHESAHGLTCKYFGGEVRDMGVMLMLLMIPAAYCDVSDAHLFESKKAKAWVTFAGLYSSFVVASLGALIWRYTEESSLLSHAGLMFAMSGFAAVLSNLNPLIPLDGYFLLSDLTGIENLRERATVYSRDYLAAVLRRKPRPEASAAEHRVFLPYYLFAIFYQLSYMLIMLSVGWLLLVRGGNLATLALFAVLVYFMYFRQYVAKLRVWNQQSPRSARFALATAVLLVVALALVDGPATLTIPARVVPAAHASVSVAESATVARLNVRSGQWVEEGDLLAELQSEQIDIAMGHLQTELAQIDAEIDNLEAGPRDEQLAYQNELVTTERLAVGRARRAVANAVANQDIGAGTAQATEGAMRQSLLSQSRLQRRTIALEGLLNNPTQQASLRNAGLRRDRVLKDFDALEWRKQNLVVRSPRAGWAIVVDPTLATGSPVLPGEPFVIVATEYALEGVIPEAFVQFFDSLSAAEGSVASRRVLLRDAKVDPPQGAGGAPGAVARAFIDVGSAPADGRTQPAMFFGASGSLTVKADKRVSKLRLWSREFVSETTLDLWRML